MTTYEIPLKPENQRLTVLIGETNYNLRVMWCAASETWVLDISDSNDVPILHGVNLVSGADLLSQHEHLGIGVKMFCGSDGDLLRPPGAADLGITSHLWIEQ